MSLSSYSLTFLDELGSSFSDDDVERVWKDRYFPLVRTDHFEENWKAVKDSNGLFVTPSRQRCRVQALPHCKASLQIMTHDKGEPRLEDIQYEAIVFSKVMYKSFCNTASEGKQEPDTVKRQRFINNYVSKLPKKWRRLVVLGDLHLRAESPSEIPQSLNLDIYQPLATPKNIRLLVLKPNPQSHANIECTLVETELPSATSYEALSYVWGKKKSDVSIILNGKRFPVMDNLAVALRQLRPRGPEPRVLWVDAVCIDQSNIQERNEQVAQMDAVYSNAAAVLVWLGKETNTSAAMFEIFNYIETSGLFQRTPFRHHFMSFALEYPFDVPHYPAAKIVSTSLRTRFLRPLVPYPPEMASFMHMLMHGTPSLDSSRWVNLMTHLCDGMAKLLLRPWWTRVWVLQELALAKKASLHCGSSSVDWELFQALLFIVIRVNKLVTGNPKSDGSPSYREYKSHTNLSERAQSVLPFFLLQKTSNYANEVLRVSIANLLSLTWNFEATNPRDRLYALLGLLPSDSKDRQDLRPEYRTTMRRLCIKTAKYFIETSGSLDILIARPALPYYIRAAPLDEVPSWVPNWAAPQLWIYSSIWIGALHPAKTLDIYIQNSIWVHGPARDASHQVAPNHSSHVDERLQVFNAGLSSTSPLDPKFSKLDEVLQVRGVTVDIIDEFGDYLDLGTIADMNRDLSNHEASGSKCREKYARIIEDWKKLARVQDGEDYAFVRGQSCREAFWRTLLVDRYWIKAEKEVPAKFNRIPKEGGGRSFESALASRGYRCQFPPQTPEDEASILGFLICEAQGLWDSASINPHCFNLVLFRTEKGYIGLGHPNLRRGDKVVVLCTAPAPVVLREYPEGHVLIGQSYLHGIMDGEAMLEEGSDGNLTEKTEFERFNLI